MVVSGKLITGQWFKMYQIAEAYYRSHGDLDVPVRYIDPVTGVNLGAWISKQRYAHHSSTFDRTITDTQEQMLDRIGMNWGKSMEEISDNSWTSGINSLTDFLNSGGTQEDITTTFDWKGYPLGPWLHKKLSAYRGAKSCSPISSDRVAQLRALGINMDARRMHENASGRVRRKKMPVPKEEAIDASETPAAVQQASETGAIRVETKSPVSPMTVKGSYETLQNGEFWKYFKDDTPADVMQSLSNAVDVALVCLGGLRDLNSMLDGLVRLDRQHTLREEG